MSKICSFDIVSEINLQEVDNGVNQAVKEIRNRYDFKGSRAEVMLNRSEKQITLLADNEMQLRSLKDVLHNKLVKRGIAIKALHYDNEEKAFDGLIRQTVKIIDGIDHEKAKGIVKEIKALKMKVQSSIMDERVRVSSKSKDDLQTVIQAVKNTKLDIPIQFVNYR